MSDASIIPPPTPTAEDLARAAALGNDTGQGIGYYIPPEFKRLGKSALGIASAVDPAQGIMRGMAASGRAFDTELSPEERKAAAIEAALETLTPAGMIGIGALAKQPAKAVFMDILTPTGATKDIAEDALSDPSRRKFLKGAAATAGIAAVAPDLVIEATEAVGKATKAAAKARINPLDMAMANIKELRRQIDEQYEILDDLPNKGRGLADAAKGSRIVKDANNSIQTAELEIIDEAYDAILMMDKADFAEAVTSASDEALEAIIEPQYDSIMGNQRLVDDGENSVRLAQEAHRRGLHPAKDENDLDKFPNAKAFVEDFYDAVDSTLDPLILEKRGVDFSVDEPYYSGLKMTSENRQLPDDIIQKIQDQKIREMKQRLEYKIIDMVDQGKTPEQIEKARAEGQADIYEAEGLPRDMDDFYAEGGVVSLKDTAVNMYR